MGKDAPFFHGRRRYERRGWNAASFDDKGASGMVKF
jgi:hypothetical protein